RRAGSLDAGAQRLVDTADIVEVRCLVELDNEMRPGVTYAVLHHEVVLTVVVRDERTDIGSVFLSGGAWKLQVHPRLEEGVSIHGNPPQPADADPASRSEVIYKAPRESKLVATRFEGRIWVPNRLGSSKKFSTAPGNFLAPWEQPARSDRLLRLGLNIGGSLGLPLVNARPIGGATSPAPTHGPLAPGSLPTSRMAMATLHHHPICPHSRFVRLVLGEMGIEVELKEERVWERRREFLALNPAGTTPVLAEESIAAVPGASVIAEYLDETRGLGLGE